MNIAYRLLACLLSLTVATGVFAQTKELDKLADTAAKAARKGDYRQADSLYAEYVGMFRRQGLQKDFQYSEILIYMARRAAQHGRTDEAIEIQREVVEVKSTAADCTFLQWASAMSDLASFYSQKGDYTQAIATGNEAMNMLRKKVGTKHQYYNIAMSNQATFYAARGDEGDIETAVTLGKAAVDGLKKDSPEYVSALNALSVYYSQAGDRPNAAKTSELVRAEAKKIMRGDMTAYAVMMNSQAVLQANAGNYEEAYAFARVAKEGFERAGNTNTLAYAKLLNNMATFMTHLQNYVEAARLLEVAMPIVEQVAGKNHPDYVRCAADLAAVYKASGDLSRADRLANDLNEAASTLDSGQNEKSARALSRRAAVFASNGNYTRAIENELQAYGFFKKRNNMLGMAQTLGHLASYYASDGKKDTALQTTEASLQLFREIGNQNAYYAQALNNSAIICYNVGQYDQATDYGRQALHIYEQRGDTTTAIYARILANNALFSYVNDSLADAISTAERAVRLQTRILGDDHPDNVTQLYNLAVYYNKAGRNEESAQQFSQAMRLQSQLIRSAFLHLTSQERENFWQRKNYVFRYAPMLAYLDPQNGDMTTMAYNSMLFTKSILLNSEVDFRSIIRKSGNKDLISKYDRLEDLREQLEGYYRLSVGERITDLNQIKKDIYSLEKVLVNECKEYGSFTENLSIDAARVSHILADDEAAIEFADIYVHGRGNTYLAFLLRKDQAAPKMIRLFSDDELDELTFDGHSLKEALHTERGINAIYNSQRLGTMLWQPLMKEMQNVKRIYFSPTSIFYQLGVEYLPCDSTHRIGDRYELHRLSSTKLLTMRGTATKPVTTATIYGGLNYDMSLAELTEQHLFKQETSDPVQLLALADTEKTRALDSLSMRGHIDFLWGALNEAQNVDSMLRAKGVETDLYTQNAGTEETFKALSGRQRSVIHIATHGFFYSESDLRKQKESLVFLGDEEVADYNPLNFSGLLLSGSKYVLSGGKLPDEYEDGVLTANEIAHTDLSKAGLVVLSACQTGVGDVRDDGVFGLQRGFKKAGAQSLIMSLWSVDDAATDMMMTLFYENLMQGDSKQQAFLSAQDTMRKSRFARPFFWASFILLDGF